MKFSKRKIKQIMKWHMFNYGGIRGEVHEDERARWYLDALDTDYPEAREFWMENYPSDDYDQQALPEGEVWELCEKYYYEAFRRVGNALNLNW